MTTCTLHLQQRPELAAAARNYHYGTERFRLAQHWSLHVYRYHARLWVADTAHDLFPGSLTIVPPDTVVEYQHQGLSTHVYAHFKLPEQDGPAIALPILTDLRTEFARFESEMELMAQALPFDRDRAEVKLWNLLFDLAGRTQGAAPELHPSLEKAMSLIELKLGENIAVTALAREVGLSHNHLTRLFRQSTGNTVVAYVRQQRAARAKHLLQHTTMPLKAIAVQVNASDLQSFSALMKKETGKPPSYWRRGES
jgi:AraC family transcriptional regulator